MLWIWIKPRGSGYCFSVYAWLEHRHRGRQRGSPARLGLPELPTVHRLPRISRQAPGNAPILTGSLPWTPLPWRAPRFMQVGTNFGLLSRLCQSCGLKMWTQTPFWRLMPWSLSPHFALKFPSIWHWSWCSGCGWGVDRGLGGGAMKITGRGLKAGAVGAHRWPCS